MIIIMKKLLEIKPNNIKNPYFISAYISSTMGPSFALDIPMIDPSNRKFILKDLELKIETQFDL